MAGGALAERMRASVAAITNTLENHVREGSLDDCSLARGAAGVAVALAHLGRDNVADRALDAAAAALAGQRLGPGLYDGFFGVAWAFAHVAKLRGDDAGDSLDEIDEAVLRLVEERQLGFDLTSGVAGAGVYALERLPAEAGGRCLEAVVNQLAELDAPQDLGVAHGQAGVVALLAAACVAGVKASTAESLLGAAVGALLAEDRGTPASGRFPHSADPAWRGQQSRLAWCYGDLGTAAALLAAAAATGNPAWRDTALEVARGAARRRDPGTGIAAAGLCHGAAGAAHVFGRIASAGDDEDLSDAARFWLERALELGAPLTNGLLEGAAGTALALNAAISPADPSWDRLLLTSPLSRPAERAG